MFEKLKNNKNYMFYVKQEIVDRLNSLDTISLNEYKNIAANSYERKLLIEKLDDEAFEYSLNQCLKNTSVPDHAPFVPVTYDEALIHTYIPELLRRLKDKYARKI